MWNSWYQAAGSLKQHQHHPCPSSSGSSSCKIRAPCLLVCIYKLQMGLQNKLMVFWTRVLLPLREMELWFCFKEWWKENECFTHQLCHIGLGGMRCKQVACHHQIAPRYEDRECDPPGVSPASWERGCSS